MIVLGIDTAGRAGGIALWGDGTAAGRDLGERGRHAEAVLPAIVGLLEETGTAWSDLAAIAVNSGPGSFTGIRVGLAAALGIAEAGGVRAGGVGCLDIHARALCDVKSIRKGSYVVSLTDVRRGEVVVATYRVGDTGPVLLGDERLVAVGDPGEAPPEGAFLTGDGVDLLWPDREDLVRWSADGPARALAAARLAREALREGTLAEAAPRYARPADARPRRR